MYLLQISPFCLPIASFSCIWLSLSCHWAQMPASHHLISVQPHPTCTLVSSPCSSIPPELQPLRLLLTPTPTNSWFNLVWTKYCSPWGSHHCSPLSQNLYGHLTNSIFILLSLTDMFPSQLYYMYLSSFTIMTLWIFNKISAWHTNCCIDEEHTSTWLPW